MTSNEAFFTDVRRLFVLLDLDADGLVDHSEATLGLSHCFEAVHGLHSPLSGAAQSSLLRGSVASAGSVSVSVSASHKQRAVADQVSWLFSATHHGSSSSPTPLQLSEFVECYQRLLHGGYEPEVLHVDLTRAIAALQQSERWRAMGQLLQAARRLFAVRLASAEAAVQRSVVQAAFRAVLADSGSGGSWSFASSKRRDAVRLVAERLLSRAGQLTEAEWLQAWKDVISTEFDYSAAITDVDTAAGVATEAVNGH